MINLVITSSMRDQAWYSDTRGCSDFNLHRDVVLGIDRFSTFFHQARLLNSTTITTTFNPPRFHLHPINGVEQALQQQRIQPMHNMHWHVRYAWNPCTTVERMPSLLLNADTFSVGSKKITQFFLFLWYLILGDRCLIDWFTRQMKTKEKAHCPQCKYVYCNLYERMVSDMDVYI